jgi:hypothetical protein
MAVMDIMPATLLVWTQRLDEKSFASAGDLTSVVQSVVRHYMAKIIV